VTTAKVFEESKNIMGVLESKEVDFSGRIVNIIRIEDDKMKVIERRSKTHEKDSIKMFGVKATKYANMTRRPPI